MVSNIRDRPARTRRLDAGLERRLSPEGLYGWNPRLGRPSIQNGLDGILFREVDHDIGPELFRQFLALRNRPPPQ
jgi:hypothetical protein